MGLRERRKKEQTARRRFEITKVLAVAVFVIVAVGAIGYLIYYNWELKQQEKRLKELLLVEVTGKLYPEVPEVTEEPDYCERIYDFEELRADNKDIYAWIVVPGTQIDYPVLQSEEDNYYLNRNLDHSGGYPGCIYSNKVNAKDFSDYITVLYGHNMRNGSMFGCLHSFESKEFFEENREIFVYTEEKRLTYEIIAAVKFTDVYIPAYYEVTKADDRDAYVEDLTKENAGVPVSHMLENLEIAPEDKLIALSTCVNGERPKRYIVTGRLVEEVYYSEESGTEMENEGEGEAAGQGTVGDTEPGTDAE